MEYQATGVRTISSGTSTPLTLPHLSYPEISSRVREFVFNPGHLCKLLLESASTHSEQTLEDPVSHLVDAFQSMKIKPTPSEQFSLHDVLPLPAHWAQRDALKILKQLTSLTSFRVEIRASEHWYFQRLSIAPAFFSAGWSAFSSTLTSLELRVPLEGMSTVLPPMGSLPLKNLENLSFRIIRASLSTNTSTTTIDTLLPMINHHAASLRALNIDVEERIDPSSFLRSITHLTRLQSFALVLPFSFHSDCALSSFKQLLQVHRNHLTDVSLRIIPTFDQHPISYSFFNLDPFGVALPKLRHISIDIHGFPSHFSRGLIPSINKFTATLVSLEISEHRWSFEQLMSLLEGFSTDSRLRDLKIFLHFLEPDVFKVLADKLPRLDTLKIDFECLGPVALTNWLHNTIPRVSSILQFLILARNIRASH